MINVTKSYLPPFDEYSAYLKGIWERNWLTNYGPLVVELEEKLKDFLSVKHVFFVSNGTVALQVAIKALDLKGEVITTPFSYVATTSSIVWQGATPVFVDIDPETLCINPSLIEAAITSNTSAILATHVYGNPCDVIAIEKIAAKHNLKVIYDAAHAFGVKYENQSIASYGDISTISFHATKLFHTIEGGAIATNDDDLAFRISYMANFGHDGQESFFGLGINGKNSEFHAAMGLCLLPRIRDLIESRRMVSAIYDSELSELALQRQKIDTRVDYTYSYYPVIFSSEEKLLLVKSTLEKNKIFPRRYFYPTLNTLNYVNYKKTPVAERVASSVLCLPLYPDLPHETVKSIADIIKSCF